MWTFKKGIMLRLIMLWIKVIHFMTVQLRILSICYIPPNFQPLSTVCAINIKFNSMEKIFKKFIFKKIFSFSYKMFYTYQKTFFFPFQIEILKTKHETKKVWLKVIKIYLKNSLKEKRNQKSCMIIFKFNWIKFKSN